MVEPATLHLLVAVVEDKTGRVVNGISPEVDTDVAFGVDVSVNIMN